MNSKFIFILFNYTFIFLMSFKICLRLHHFTKSPVGFPNGKFLIQFSYTSFKLDEKPLAKLAGNRIPNKNESTCFTSSQSYKLHVFIKSRECYREWSRPWVRSMACKRRQQSGTFHLFTTPVIRASLDLHKSFKRTVYIFFNIFWILDL